MEGDDWTQVRQKKTGGKQGNQDGGKLKEKKVHWNIKKNHTETFQNKRGSRFNIKIKGKNPKSWLPKKCMKLTKVKDVWKKRKWNDWPVKGCVHPLTSTLTQSSRPRCSLIICFHVPPTHIWRLFNVSSAALSQTPRETAAVWTRSVAGAAVGPRPEGPDAEYMRLKSRCCWNKRRPGDHLLTVDRLNQANYDCVR